MGPIERADDHVEPLVLRRVLIQAHLKILPLIVVVKKHSAPFDVEDAIWWTAGSRDENTAGSARKTRAAAQAQVGAHIFPQTKDGKVIRALIGRYRQTRCEVAARFVNTHEVEAPIGINVNAVVDLVIQLEWERQGDERIAVVNVIPRIGSARHDRVGSWSYGILAGSATLYCVVRREDVVRVTKGIHNRSGSNVRRQAAPEEDIQREPRSRVS